MQFCHSFEVNDFVVENRPSRHTGVTVILYLQTAFSSLWILYEKKCFPTHSQNEVNLHSMLGLTKLQRGYFKQALDFLSILWVGLVNEVQWASIYAYLITSGNSIVGVILFIYFFLTTSLLFSYLLDIRSCIQQ